VPLRLWRERVLHDHPELGSHLADVLQAISNPDHVASDPVFDDHRRHYLRNAGPSRWLLVDVGEPQIGEGEETPEGQVLRYAPGTQSIVGLTVVGARRLLDRDGNLTVTIPEPIEASAGDFAQALGST
jgi:hypothetical protein